MSIRGCAWAAGPCRWRRRRTPAALVAADAQLLLHEGDGGLADLEVRHAVFMAAVEEARMRLASASRRRARSSSPVMCEVRWASLEPWPSRQRTASPTRRSPARRRSRPERRIPRGQAQPRDVSRPCPVAQPRAPQFHRERQPGHHGVKRGSGPKRMKSSMPMNSTTSTVPVPVKAP